MELEKKWACEKCSKGFDVPSEFTVYLDEAMKIVMDVVFKCPFCNSDRIHKNMVQKTFF